MRGDTIPASVSSRSSGEEEKWPRELAISQAHLGTTLLAGIVGLTATCLVATLAMGAVWQIATWAGWLACLILPVVILVLFLGALFLNWGERLLHRLWPSGKHLTLSKDELTLSRRGKALTKIVWHEPFDMLRWRMMGADPLSDAASSSSLCLACQLRQHANTIGVFTRCSAQDWRLVPGWKQFPLLESIRRPSQAEVMRGLIKPSRRQRDAAPSYRGVTSFPTADPEIVWPAEMDRQRNGWELGFDDFRALMGAIERSAETL
jgi:hypothetical protein